MVTPPPNTSWDAVDAVSHEMEVQAARGEGDLFVVNLTVIWLPEVIMHFYF